MSGAGRMSKKNRDPRGFVRGGLQEGRFIAVGVDYIGGACV
jgi:hypothetical protein